MVESILSGYAGVTEAPAEPKADLRSVSVSPVAHLSGRFTAAEVSGPRGVRIRELRFLTMVGLRVVPGTAAAERVQARLGAALPARCGAVATADGCSVLW